MTSDQANGRGRVTRWRRMFAGSVGILGLVLVGAGWGSGSSRSSIARAAGASSTSSAYLANINAQVNKYYKGTYRAPPTTAPKHKPGENIWLISTDQSLTISAAAIAGAQAAAQSLGWHTTVADGKSSPTVQGAAIRQAIAAKANGIFMYIIDCDLVKGPLEQAKAAGIKIVAAESLDCNDTQPGQKPLFSGVVSYIEGPYKTWIYDYGKVQALWAIATAKGKAHVLYPRTDETEGFSVIREGSAAELATCSACSIAYYGFSPASLGPTLRQETEAALLRNPNTNSMILSFDGLGPAGLNAALQASGRAARINVIGSEGDPAIIQIIKKGGVGEVAGVGIPPGWEGYAGMDALVRLFDGKPVLGSGIGLQLFDKGPPAHNIPSIVERYVAPVNYVQLYDKAWGVK